MEMNKELISKAKTAKTPEELLCLAKENGEEMTEESAKAYFDMLHQKQGEMTDDELDNVSGGCNKSDGRKIVSALHSCTAFNCKKCGGKGFETFLGMVCNNCGKDANCTRCKYCSYEKGLWLCNYDGN